MKTFYLFFLNENFYYTCLKDYKCIYTSLTEIANINKENINYAMSIFNQIAHNINKNFLDRKLFIEMHKDIYYQKYGDIHYYKNTVTHEKSYMEIKNIYIKVKTNMDICFFFEWLNKFDEYIFIIDFNNANYFFLKRPKILV